LTAKYLFSVRIKHKLFIQLIAHMKKYYFQLLFFVLCWACCSTVNAQNPTITWGNFDSFISQADSSARAEYLNNLQTLLNSGKIGVFRFDAAMDSLMNASNSGVNPAAGIDSLNFDFAFGLDSLNNLISGANFSAADSISIVNEYTFLNDLWNTRSDSLLQVFGNNSGNFSNAPFIDMQQGYPTDGQAYITSLDSILNNQQNALNDTPANGIGGFDAVLDEVFNPANFTNLEIFAGQQTATAGYYDLKYDVKLPVVGIRSVEQFDRVWEPRWRVQGSFLTADPVFESTEVDAAVTKNAPFMFNGNFHMMFNPTVIDGSVTYRLISLLGVDAATYAPAHKNAAIATTLNNRGYTTGWGPVIGGGFATTTGNLTVYGLSTITYGDVVIRTGEQDYTVSNYRYRSARVEAGIRYGNLATLRYEIGLSNNWANNGAKNVRYHQITVGLPTTALFH
jgi:hypothetical protein